MNKDPFPYLKALFVKGFSNLKYFKTAFAFGAERVLFNKMYISELEKDKKNPVDYFEKECLSILALAEKAEKNIVFNRSRTSKKFKVTLERIKTRAGIFLRYLEDDEVENIDFIEPEQGYLLMQDSLILKEIYFEFLEDVGEKLKNIISFGVKPELISDLKSELEPFQNNKPVQKILGFIDLFEEKVRPIAKAYLTLTEDEKKQKLIHQLRLYLKNVG